MTEREELVRLLRLHLTEWNRNGNQREVFVYVTEDDHSVAVYAFDKDGFPKAKP